MRGEGRRQMLEVSVFFHEDLVKVRELASSLACYDYRRGWGRRPVSLFHSLPENGAKTDGIDGQHSEGEGDRRAALHGRQRAADHYQSVLRHHCCLPMDKGA